jgi:hypothetical protein
MDNPKLNAIFPQHWLNYTLQVEPDPAPLLEALREVYPMLPVEGQKVVDAAMVKAGANL